MTSYTEIQEMERVEIEEEVRIAGEDVILRIGNIHVNEKRSPYRGGITTSDGHYIQPYVDRGPSSIGTDVRIYPWLKGESVLENLFGGRHTRPWRYLAKFIPDVVHKTELFNPNAEHIVIGWRQTAGCSCPCSPGFVARNTANVGYDIHFDYEIVAR